MLSALGGGQTPPSLADSESYVLTRIFLRVFASGSEWAGEVSGV
jgi:hypothetical protein